jgi:starch-binding outer membrane protein, SusD/RagB family
MKNIKILVIIIAFIINACEDVLEKQPLDIITDVTLWSEPVLIDDYLNQCYSEMRFYFEMPYGQNINYLMDNRALDMLNISDEANQGWVSTPKTHWIGIGGGHIEWWGYPIVRKLNIFIDKMENLEIEVDENYKKQRIAEARFLRAFAYFNMVKRYGGIPLIIRVQELNDPDEELYRERDKEEEIYQFIFSEIDEIASDLPEDYGDGRATKYAALALKCRASMYAASIAQWGNIQLDGIIGIPADKAASYWQISYDVAEAIISSGKFALYNGSDDKAQNFRNLFLDENNSEVIFSERFDGISGKGHIYDMMEVPKFYHVWGGGQHTSLYLEMVESFDNIDGTPGIIDRDKIENGHFWTVEELWGNKDPRFKASVYTHGTPWVHKNGPFILDYHNGIEVAEGEIVTTGAYKGILCKSPPLTKNARTPFGVLKYLDEARAVVHERHYSSTDYIVFRLGEILLNYAEAAIELNKNGDALWAVNEIRKRAGMPEYATLTRDDVRKERKIELAFEGNRYWDVRRWRTAKDDLTKSFHGLRIILDGASIVEGQYDVLTQKFKLAIIENVSGIPSPYFDEKHYYLPISLSRTSNNPNLIENPGYH